MAQRKDPSNADNSGESQEKRKRPRRIKGTGSVYLRSDGRWAADFIVEATGRKKTLYAPAKNNTQKAANDLLQQALLEQKQGILATGPKQKVGDYLNWWLDEVHKHKIRPGTYIVYRGLLDRHILPGLGHIQMRKLTTKQIQAFYNKKLEEGRAPSTVHNMHNILHNALKGAVKGRHISFNPADGIEIPANEPIRPGQSFTLEQARLLLEESQGQRIGVFIALALTTGMRHGEMLALRWSDVDFALGTIFIHRSLSYRSDRGHYRFIEGDPKTKSSRRIIPLLPIMREILEEHRKKQNAARFQAGAQWQEKDLVLCAKHGGFLRASDMRRVFDQLLEKVGLSHMPIHDLRHTASTLWQSLGIDPTVRQKMLGHGTIDMTMTVYSHVLPSMQKDATERMNKLFQKPDLEG